MQYYKREFPTSDINVYPFGDCHIGSPQYCHPLAKLVVNTVKNDDRGYMVLMGDLIENAIVGSLGDVYTQTMPPAEQLEFVVDLLEPVKEKILFMIRGNHEFRTFKTVGMFPEQYLSAKLGLVPFLGTSVYAMFLLESHTPKSFKCYFHHGSGGGSTQGGKVNRLRSLREIAPDADATFMGHVHTTGRVAHTCVSAATPINPSAVPCGAI